MANTAPSATDSTKAAKETKLLAAPKSSADKKPASETKKPTKKSKTSWMWHELSWWQFYGSMLLIFLAGAAFLGYNFYILNPNFLDQMNQVPYKPVTVGNRTLYLVVETPEDNSLVYESSIVISGSTNPNSGVVITGMENNDTVTADENGHFSKAVNLVQGLNLIEITTFDNNGNVKSEIRTIYYTSEKLS